MKEGKKLQGVYIYALTNGIANGLFLPLWIVYLSSKNISLLLIGVLGSILECVGMVFQVPFGAIADFIGHKKALLIANILVSIAILVFAISQNFEMFVAFSVLLGIGNAFETGAFQSWIFNILQNKREEKNFGKYYRKVCITQMSGTAIASLGVGKIYSLNPQLPFYLSALFCGFTVIDLLLIKSYMPILPKSDNLKNTIHTKIFDIIRECAIFFSKNFKLKLFVLSAVIFAFAFDGFERYYQLLLKDKGCNYDLIGFVSAFSMIFSIIGLFLENRILQKNETKSIMIIECAISTFGISMIFTSNYIISFGSIIILLGLEQMLRPTFEIVLSNSFKDEFRATGLSFFEFFCSIGEILSGTIIGFIANQWSIIGGLSTCSALIMISAIITFFTVIVEKLSKHYN